MAIAGSRNDVRSGILSTMPELPEVETVCRLMRRVLIGKRIAEAVVMPDPIVLSGAPVEAYVECLLGKTVTGVGRKGKFWWLELEEKPWLFGHLGMSGWIREVGAESLRLHSHGKAPLDDAEGAPKFLKLLLTAEDGRRIAFTDGRRLGRLWLSEGPETDARVKRLGFDVMNSLPDPKILGTILAKRKVAIKGVLLDQSVFAGVGNWIADEVLYHAGIAPQRLACDLSGEEVGALHRAIEQVIRIAVEVDADSARFPEGWLFTHRWGGHKGSSEIDGQAIRRETVAGRTTAWIPSRQS
ncbi:MAG: DNA-formamidopyrimidine glycosylase family protein [Fimbriimonas sp.]|nr:DNA-formamidopyrimidine glycosylase family protein [Fimbriimonas sp.]